MISAKRRKRFFQLIFSFLCLLNFTLSHDTAGKEFDWLTQSTNSIFAMFIQAQLSCSWQWEDWTLQSALGE